MDKQLPTTFTNASGDNQCLTIELPECLDFESVSRLWNDTLSLLQKVQPQSLILQASRVNHCDGSGIALLSMLRSTQHRSEHTCDIRGLNERFKGLLDNTHHKTVSKRRQAEPERRAIPIRVGQTTVEAENEVRSYISFIGEFCYQLLLAFKTPSRVRWGDTVRFIEMIGPNALPITALLGFLFGLILAFQGVIPLQNFGAEIYVIRLVGISLVRELAPFLTAIIIVARTASAFAAELGTMSVNREVDALNTMGIESVRFLVLPRVLAVMFIMPALMTFLAIFGLFGCYLVSLSLGFGFHIFMNELYNSFTYTPIITSIIKSIVFGLLVAMTGCYHGLKTQHGSSAVGISTTTAVVNGIVTLSIADGIFSLITYSLGI